MRIAANVLALCRIKAELVTSNQFLKGTKVRLNFPEGDPSKGLWSTFCQRQLPGTTEYSFVSMPKTIDREIPGINITPLQSG